MSFDHTKRSASGTVFKVTACDWCKKKKPAAVIVDAKRMSRSQNPRWFHFGVYCSNEHADLAIKRAQKREHKRASRQERD